MPFSLQRLSPAQLADLAQGRPPAGVPGPVADQALPPPFIAQAALDGLAAGGAAHWCAVFLVLRAQGGEVVGSCCFKGEPRGGRVEIGYGIAPACQRQGAASAAVNALLNLAREGSAAQVLAEVSPDNLASTGLVAQLGFVNLGLRVDEQQETVCQWVASVGADRQITRQITQHIAALADWRGATLARMRALIHAAGPAVTEELKWRGTPVWSHDGILCTGESYKQVVKLTFAQGAALPDPARLFNASLEGKVRRAIDIREGEAVDEAAFQALVLAAVALNQAAQAKRGQKKAKG